MGSPSSEISGTCGSQRPVPRAPLWCWAGCCSAGSRSTPRNCNRQSRKTMHSLCSTTVLLHFARSRGFEIPLHDKKILPLPRQAVTVVKNREGKESRICKTNRKFDLSLLLSPEVVIKFPEIKIPLLEKVTRNTIFLFPPLFFFLFFFISVRYLTYFTWYRVLSRARCDRNMSFHAGRSNFFGRCFPIEKSLKI